jgi:GxxExxY protein
MLTDPDGCNHLTSAIIGCAVRVHQALGPGLFESVYSECMQYEPREQRLRFIVGRPVPLIYKGQTLTTRFYADLVVEDRVIVELKAVLELAEIHRRQLLTQLKLTGLSVGLLMNFNVVVLTTGGVKRVVNPGSLRATTITGDAEKP